MHTKTIQIITILGVVFLLSSCNKKKSHFEDGGDLVCTNSSLIGNDVTRTININNSAYSSSPRPHGSKEGFYYGDSFFNVSNTFFDIDDCQIK